MKRLFRRIALYQMIVELPNHPAQNVIFDNTSAIKEAILGMGETFGFELGETDLAALNNLDENSTYAFVFTKEGIINITVMTIESMAKLIDTYADEVKTGADPLITYVLMRTDVPDYFGPKAQAQSNHAGTKMVFDALSSGNTELLAELTEWEQEAGGFGTCIVLHTSAAEMRQAVSLAQLLGVHAGVVHDPTFPVRDGDRYTTLPIDTCAYVFGRKSKCRPIVGGFDLLRIS